MRALRTLLSIAVLSAALAGCGGYYGYGYRNSGYNSYYNGGYNGYGYDSYYNGDRYNAYGYNNNANWGQPYPYRYGNAYNGNYAGGRVICWNCGWQ